MKIRIASKIFISVIRNLKTDCTHLYTVNMNLYTAYTICKPYTRVYTVCNEFILYCVEEWLYCIHYYSVYTISYRVTGLYRLGKTCYLHSLLCK